MWWRLALLLLVTGSCGPGVYSALSAGPTLVTLRGEVVNAAPVGTPEDSIAAAVVWAQLSPEVEGCLSRAATATDVLGCTGTDFRPQLNSVTVPVKPAFPSAVEVPLHDVPPLEALGESRLGYGLLVVLHDGNRNGALDLVPASERDGPDQVLGTSLAANSDIEGDYLVYRERDVPAAWNAFRILAQCPEPPRGYFIMRLRRSAQSLTCQLEAATAGLKLELASTERVRKHVCQYAPSPKAQPAPAAAPSAGATWQCWGPTSLELFEPGTCRRPVRYDLSGSPPPAWWPCQKTDSTALELRRAGQPLTADLDALFTLGYLSGPGRFRLGALRIKVGNFTLTTLDSTVIVGAPTFRNDDRDGDGLFSAGDVLAVQEDEPSRFVSSPGLPLNVEVTAESDGRVTPLGPPLSWSP